MRLYSSAFSARVLGRSRPSRRFSQLQNSYAASSPNQKHLYLFSSSIPFIKPKPVSLNPRLQAFSSFVSDKMAFGGRFRDLLKKYGKVALGVHLSVSAVSIGSLYVAIKNNVDVESLLSKVGLSGPKQDPASNTPAPVSLPDLPDDVVFEDRPPVSDLPEQTKNRSTELAVSSGGALALAVLCNKALFPVRVPITIALTPAVSRFLARRRIIKNHV